MESTVSTYLALNVQIVFSTKHRQPFLNKDIIAPAHAYLGGVIKGLGGVPIQIGGVEDHVHILMGMKSTHSVAYLVQEIKKASGDWIREEIPNFLWQDGYAAFSVSPERLTGVSKYIENQAEHHHVKTFREEYIELLEFAGIAFDPKYLD